MKKIVLGMVGCGLLMGCADTGLPVSEPVHYDAALHDEISQQLADSAARSSNALEELAMIKTAKSPKVNPGVDVNDLAPDLQRVVTTVWNGPAQDLVEQLAKNLGYTYRVTGGTSKNPVDVNIDVHDVAIGQVLEDIGLQSSPSASIIVNPNTRDIEFRNTLSPEQVESAPPVMKHRVLKRLHVGRVAHVHVKKANCSHLPAGMSAVQ